MTTTVQALRLVVTGGTGALGRAVVARLVSGGAAEVVVPVFDPSELEGWALARDPKVRVVEGLDLRKEADAEALFAGLSDLWGMCHTVGGFAMAPIEQTRADDVRAMLELNAVSAAICARAAVAAIRRSPQPGGRLVFVSARPALVATGGMAAYAMAKAAVAALTQSLATELASERIWVNAIVPSTMDTPSNRKAMPDADFSRWASVDEVARTVGFLLSPDNECTRGALVPVYGRTG